MSIPSLVTVDLASLPAALLADAKVHMRVDHSDDDAYIRKVIARAIAHRELIWAIRINPATISWAPAQTDFCNGQAVAPIRPIISMTAAAGGDVSSQYTLVLQGTFGAPPYLIIGTWQSGLTFSFSSGYSAATLPPGVEDNIMTLATHLYEHREIFVDRSPEQVPTAAIDSEMAWWVPRA